MYSQRTNYSFQVPAPGSKNCLSPSKPSYSERCCLGGADVTVPKTCRSAINKHGYLWSSLRPVRITVLPGCSPGSWEAESCQSRRYLSLARACLAAARGTLLDCPGGTARLLFVSLGQLSEGHPPLPCLPFPHSLSMSGSFTFFFSLCIMCC